MAHWICLGSYDLERNVEWKYVFGKLILQKFSLSFTQARSRTRALTHARIRTRIHTHTHTHTHTCAKSSAWHERFIYRSFRGACCLRFHGLRIPTIKQSTRGHSQGNFNRQEHVCESLKSRTNITESFVCSWSAEQRYIKGTLYTAKHNCIISKRLKYSERSCYTLGFAISVGWELRHGPI
jgi:hypothetical protein